MSKITIAVASGKGGTGKTLFSTNLLSILQQQGKNICLVDCDAEEPNALGFLNGNLLSSTEVFQKVPVINEDRCTYCGKCHEYCSYNALFVVPPMRIIRVLEDLCHGCGACMLACDFDAIREKKVPLGTVRTYELEEQCALIESRMNVGVYSPVSIIKEAIRKAGAWDIVLLDSPPGTSCPFIQTVAQADFVILITEPTPFGLSDLKQSVDTLKSMYKPYSVVINRAGMGDDAIYQYLTEENIPLLLEIPFDKEIARYYSNGILFTQHLTSWAQRFSEAVQPIFENYGNCDHQR